MNRGLSAESPSASRSLPTATLKEASKSTKVLPCQSRWRTLSRLTQRSRPHFPTRRQAIEKRLLLQLYTNAASLEFAFTRKGFEDAEAVDLRRIRA